MCYNLAAKQRIKALQEKYPVKQEDVYLSHGYYQVSGFTHPKWPVFTEENPYESVLMQWGLTPSWVKDEAQAKEIGKPDT